MNTTETILSIAATTRNIMGTPNHDNYDYDYEGYVVTTDQQEIFLGIDNDQQCCEWWGYFMSEDDLDTFVGAKLLRVEVVDTCLRKEKLVDVYDGGTMFVDLVTDRGVLQFVAYNDHNGYYGHYATVRSTQRTETVLV